MPAAAAACLSGGRPGWVGTIWTAAPASCSAASSGAASSPRPVPPSSTARSASGWAAYPPLARRRRGAAGRPREVAMLLPRGELANSRYRSDMNAPDFCGGFWDDGGRVLSQPPPPRDSAAPPWRRGPRVQAPGGHLARLREAVFTHCRENPRRYGEAAPAQTPARALRKDCSTTARHRPDQG